MSKENTLEIERIFDAPVQKVWDAWTNPDQLKQWWSPAGMENQHASVDFRVGGQFRWSFVTEDGKAYWGRGVYKEIDEPHFFSYEDCHTDEKGNDVPPSYYGVDGDEIEISTVEVRLDEREGQTTMVVTMSPAFSADEVEVGWHSMFDKLEKLTKE